MLLGKNGGGWQCKRKKIIAMSNSMIKRATARSYRVPSRVFDMTHSDEGILNFI